MLNDNCGFTINRVPLIILLGGRFAKGSLPTRIAKRFQFLIYDIGRHDRVDNQLAEPLHLGFSAINGTTKIIKAVIHEQIPSQVNRILFSDRLIVVKLGQMVLLDYKLRVWNARVVRCWI